MFSENFCEHKQMLKHTTQRNVLRDGAYQSVKRILNLKQKDHKSVSLFLFLNILLEIFRIVKVFIYCRVYDLVATLQNKTGPSTTEKIVLFFQRAFADQDRPPKTKLPFSLCRDFDVSILMLWVQP